MQFFGSFLEKRHKRTAKATRAFAIPTFIGRIGVLGELASLKAVAKTF